MAYLFVFSEARLGELVEREIARLEKVVEQNPANPDTRVQLALLYSHEGFQQPAIAQLEAALELNESHQGALVALGHVYVAQGRYGEAIEPYSKVVELNKENPLRGVNRQLEAVYYYLGVSYFNLGKTEDAIRSLEEALSIDRTDADAWYMLGATYQRAEEFEKAVEYYGEAVRFVPDFTEAYQGLALCYEKTGQAHFVQYANAMIAYSSDSPGEAVRQLEKVVAASPDFAEAHLGLGLAYEETGKMAKAISAYHRALKIKPDLWLARARLQSLGVMQE